MREDEFKSVARHGAAEIKVKGSRFVAEAFPVTDEEAAEYCIARTGGLIRAYGAAASEALDAAGEKRNVISEHLTVSFDYDDTSPAMHVVQKFGAEVVDSAYTDVTEMTLAVPRSRAADFEEAFVDALGGRGVIEKSGD